MKLWTLTLSLMAGIKTTLLLFLIVIVLSLPLGFLVTLLLRSRIKPVRWIATAFVYVVRGTPLLLQLMFLYLGLPFIPVIGEYLTFSRWTAALLGFTINYAAYFAEIFRGGLLAVDKGQYEAAQVLGLSRRQTITKVVLPQMIRVALPSVTNESVTLVKDTSLLYAVSVPDLLHFTKTTVSRTADPTAFVVAGVIYLLMNTVLTLFFKKLEQKYDY